MVPLSGWIGLAGRLLKRQISENSRPDGLSFRRIPPDKRYAKRLASEALVQKSECSRPFHSRESPAKKRKSGRSWAGKKESVLASVIALSELTPAVASEAVAARDLHHHAKGFYDEVDKLAKGKANA